MEGHANATSVGDTKHKSTEMQCTDSGQKPFRFLDLPPELWVKIGKVAIDALPLIHNNTIIIKYSTSWHTGKKPKQKPSLALTCRKLHYELIPYFYSTKVNLMLTMNSYFEVRLGKWLKAIGTENRKRVKTLLALQPRGTRASKESLEKDWEKFQGVKIALTKSRLCCQKSEFEYVHVMKLLE